MFTQRQEQNIYKESKQTHRGGEVRGIKMPVGTGLRGKTQEQARRKLMAAAALSSKTFISSTVFFLSMKKKQSLVLFTVLDFREDQKRSTYDSPALLQNRQARVLRKGNAFDNILLLQVRGHSEPQILVLRLKSWHDA